MAGAAPIDSHRISGRGDAWGPRSGADGTPAHGSEYDCFNQGIQSGWSDVYGNNLDCQWLDITGIPAGDYLIQVEINPDRAFEEADFTNNVATVPVRIR